MGYPERSARLELDGHTCIECGADHNIEVHHIERRIDGGSNDLTNLITLCKICHGIQTQSGWIVSEKSIGQRGLPFNFEPHQAGRHHAFWLEVGYAEGPGVGFMRSRYRDEWEEFVIVERLAGRMISDNMGNPFRNLHRRRIGKPTLFYHVRGQPGGGFYAVNYCGVPFLMDVRKRFGKVR